MIYVLFIVSFLAYLTLGTFQAYYEYFSIEPIPKNKKDKEVTNKHQFKFTPKILIRTFQKLKRPNCVMDPEIRTVT